jgi:N-acetylglucosaminyldiphosphoundecaprenol N-acetyl-beta-D-mannosaminyltransferase
MRKLLIILGVPIDDLTMEQALERIEEFIAHGRATGQSHQIATVNADFVTKSLDDPELRLILQECDLATADGMPLVWGARLLGVPLTGRVTGADLVPALAERAAQKGYSLYFLGGASGVAQRAKTILETQYPGLRVVGIFSPPVSSVLEMDASIVENIRAAKPDILLVAFGNPKQEKWISMHAREVAVPVMIGVGGTLDFIAGITKRAPLWMQRAGLEWVFRLLQEPRRLWKRYVIDLGGFGYFFVRQWLALRGKRAPGIALPSAETVMIQNMPILNLVGRLDAHNAAAFTDQATAALAANPRIIIHLARATFLDSRALGALVALAKRARNAGGDVFLAAVPPTILKTLALTRLDKLFEMFPDVANALQRASAPTNAPAPVSAPRAGWLVVAAPRRLDATTATEFSEHCVEQLKTNPHLTLDLSNTVFLASAGMAALLQLHKRARESGGALHVAACSRDVTRSLQLAKLDTVLTIFPTLQAATGQKQ